MEPYITIFGSFSQSVNAAHFPVAHWNLIRGSEHSSNIWSEAFGYFENSITLITETGHWAPSLTLWGKTSIEIKHKNLLPASKETKGVSITRVIFNFEYRNKKFLDELLA